MLINDDDEKVPRFGGKHLFLYKINFVSVDVVLQLIFTQKCRRMTGPIFTCVCVWGGALRSRAQNCPILMPSRLCKAGRNPTGDAFLPSLYLD